MKIWYCVFYESYFMSHLSLWLFSYYRDNSWQLIIGFLQPLEFFWVFWLNLRGKNLRFENLRGLFLRAFLLGLLLVSRFRRL